MELHSAFVNGLVLGACRNRQHKTQMRRTAAAAEEIKAKDEEGPTATEECPPPAVGRIGDAALLTLVAAFAGVPLGRRLRNLREFVAFASPACGNRGE